MVRVVVVFLVAAVVWLFLAKLFKRLKSADIDWTGVTAIVGFIALAFYLRHVTGIG